MNFRWTKQKLIKFILNKKLKKFKIYSFIGPPSQHTVFEKNILHNCGGKIMNNEKLKQQLIANGIPEEKIYSQEEYLTWYGYGYYNGTAKSELEAYGAYQKFIEHVQYTYGFGHEEIKRALILLPWNNLGYCSKNELVRNGIRIAGYFFYEGRLMVMVTDTSWNNMLYYKIDVNW